MFKEKLEKIIIKTGVANDETYYLINPEELSGEILSLIADELPKEEPHSKDCIYVIEPCYFDKPSKEKYCTCGAFDNNYALKEVKTKLGIEKGV